MGITLANNAHTTLSADASSTDTTIYVEDIDSFPTLDVGDYFYLTLERTSGAMEIVKVTQINASSFTVVRGQEDTIPISFPIGSSSEMRITVQGLEDKFDDAVEAHISDTAYASSWNSVTTIAPSKNAVYDKLEAMSSLLLSDGDKGSITVSSSGTVWTLDDAAVTLAKLANLNQYQLIGRSSSGSGVPQALSTSADVYSFLGAATFNAASVLTGNVSASPLSIAFTPVTNPGFLTYTGYRMSGTTVQENAREFMQILELTSETGSTEVTNLRDKVTSFRSLLAKPGTGDVWVDNTLLVLQSGLGNVNGHIHEADLNNLNQHYGDGLAAAGLASPTLFGWHVTGFSSFNATSAYAVSMAAGSTGFWNRGYTVGPASVLQSAFENHSDCDVVFANYSNADYVLYSASATSAMSVVGNVGFGSLPASGFKVNISDTGAARIALAGTTSALFRFRDTGATDDYEIIDLDLDDGVFSLIARDNAGSVRVTPFVADTVNNRVDITTLRVNNTGLMVKDTDASHYLSLVPGSNLSANRALSIVTGDSDRTLTFTANASIGGTNTGDQTITLTGEVTGAGTGSFATTIANDAVTYAKMQNVASNNRILGRISGAGGDVEELTAANVKTVLALTSSDLSDVASGTYTPTFTSVTNIASSTAYSAQYMRVGSVVTVSAKVDIDPTAAATLSQLGMSLPIASNFSTDSQCAGAVSSPGTNGTGLIRADATNDRAELWFVPGADSNQTWFVHFTYSII